MRWLLAAALLGAATLQAQVADAPAGCLVLASDTAGLPDAPGYTLGDAGDPDAPDDAGKPKTCKDGPSQTRTLPNGKQEVVCPEDLNPYQRFLNSPVAIPLSPKQKFRLALHDIYDPFNIVTIMGNAAFTVGINSHTAYGPGMRGFARDTVYSFSQDANGEIIGTFAIASLAHEDPHYHRMAHGPVTRRLLHAISRTAIAQHDDGTPMPNYEVLLTYPISAELSNLYVPGVAGNGPSTVRRVALGYATNPASDIITEFLPDLAKRVHINVIVVQRLLNQIAVSNQ